MEEEDRLETVGAEGAGLESMCVEIQQVGKGG
jgi:hypothetical protein